MSELVPGYDPLPEDEDDEDPPLTPTPEHWTDQQNDLYSRFFTAVHDNEQAIDSIPSWKWVAHILGSVAAEMLDPESNDMLFTDMDTGDVIGHIKMKKRTLS